MGEGGTVGARMKVTVINVVSRDPSGVGGHDAVEDHWVVRGNHRRGASGPDLGEARMVTRDLRSILSDCPLVQPDRATVRPVLDRVGCDRDRTPIEYRVSGVQQPAAIVGVHSDKRMPARVPVHRHDRHAVHTVDGIRGGKARHGSPPPE